MKHQNTFFPSEKSQGSPGEAWIIYENFVLCICRLAPSPVGFLLLECFPLLMGPRPRRPEAPVWLAVWRSRTVPDETWETVRMRSGRFQRVLSSQTRLPGSGSPPSPAGSGSQEAMTVDVGLWSCEVEIAVILAVSFKKIDLQHYFIFAI